MGCETRFRAVGARPLRGSVTTASGLRAADKEFMPPHARGNDLPPSKTQPRPSSEEASQPTPPPDGIARRKPARTIPIGLDLF